MPRPEELRLRERFRPLILANPNYFGNLENSQFDEVLKIQFNTAFESIGCVGYQPEFERLHAVVYVTQTSGYGGGICSNGTPEFVRFYLSFDNGATWEDQGIASFTAYDIPENKTRLEYAVTKRIDPDRKFCFQDNGALCRAILSWNNVPPPNMPDFVPVWGDRHDTHIQIEPRKLIIFDEFLKAAEVKLPEVMLDVVDLSQPMPVAQKKLTLKDRVELYKGVEIEPHRLALPELHAMMLKPSLTQDLSSPDFTAAFPNLDIDFSQFDDFLFPTDGNTSYEELECIGYDPRTSHLVGVIRIKRPTGYSGGPCTAGSQEYVTFWADFNNNGTFETCLGTTSVNVHDFRDIPRGGLEYSVFLKIDVEKLRRPCQKGAALVPIRAILAWETPPPCANPNYVPVWGNREETIIHIYPGQSLPGKYPVISSVSDMAVVDINGAGYSTGFGIETGFVAENSPFGGRIDIAGKIAGGTSMTKYRVMVKPNGAPDTAYVPLTLEPVGLKLTLVTFNGVFWTINSNHVVHDLGDGYYPYEDYSATHFVDGNLLMRWYTGAAEDGGLFDLRVDVSIDGNPANDVHSGVVTVKIDNKPPDVDLDINLGAGVECADFNLGVTFDGSFKAIDTHFRRFWWQLLPAGPAMGVIPQWRINPADPLTPGGGRSIFSAGGTIADPGVAAATYVINTAGPPGGPMKPCGYSLTLWCEDRTNVNSGTTRNRNHTSVGFCLRG